MDRKYKKIFFIRYMCGYDMNENKFHLLSLNFKVRDCLDQIKLKRIE